MNKKLGLAVAGALLAASASANAGITIPAGDWTVDLSGNVNAFMSETRTTGTAMVGGLASGTVGNGTTTRTANTFSTGLLPNFLSFSGSSRQNDMDVTWLISLNPGGFSSTGAVGGSKAENRQAFFTFGDKSWGTVKIGKDLGIYASDAILNDMTLLGVGAGGGAPLNTTTYGRIGTGFQYADWKEQIAYTTPNWNGFQATVGVTQAWNQTSNSGVVGSTATVSMASANRAGAAPAYEGKASYSFAADQVSGKVWVSGIAQKVEAAAGVTLDESIAYSVDVGANVSLAGFNLTGYYYDGRGTGTTFMMYDGYDTTGHARDTNGGYVQATYVLPTQTKVGVSWGRSNLDKTSTEAAAAAKLVSENEMWTVGVYHPLTKSVNLVAEYNHVDSTSQDNSTAKSNGVSLGGILFF